MIYRFDNYRLDTAAAQLTCHNEDVAIEPRVFDLLLLLIENRHRVVTKDEIVEQIWGGRFTSDAAIATGIKSVRKALQDDGDVQRLVRTQRGKGFRFVGTVEAADDGAPAVRVTDTAPAQPLTPVPDPTLIQPAGKPSLVVLPLQCLLPGDQDSLLAEAISHELIQALARLRWLRVIARGTAFQFRLPEVDIRQVGAALDVRYALYGSLEPQRKGWAINIELANCQSAELIWAERYTTASDNLFEIRQMIVARVIGSLETYIPLQEASQALTRSTESLDAWAHYHLGLRHMFRFNQNDNAQATACFQRAIELDPHFARAWGGLSFTRFQDAFVRYDSHKAEAVQDARRFAETGVDLDPLDPFTNYNMGRSFWLEGDTGSSQGWLERSVTLSPNFAQGHYSCAFSEVMQGRTEQALLDCSKAQDTSPLDPLMYAIQGVRSFSHVIMGDYQQAMEFADRAVRSPGAHYLIRMLAAAAYGVADDKTNAEYWFRRTLELKPDANTSHFFASFPFVSTEVRRTFDSGLKKAGFQAG